MHGLSHLIQAFTSCTSSSSSIILKLKQLIRSENDYSVNLIINIIIIILLIISNVPRSNTNSLCHQNKKTLIIIIIAPLISHVPRGAQSHPPPLQGGLIVAGGTTTGETELDSVEILDRYYCKFKPASTSYQSLIVVGLEMRM